MKTILRTVLIAVPAMVLAGCATGGGMASQPTPNSGPRYITDAEFVSRVERTALSRGVEVHWVQPPIRRVASGDQ